MYLRFTILRNDDRSRMPQGVFQAAYELRDSAQLESYELDRLREILSWFAENLRSPKSLSRHENARAICWFHPTAFDAIARIRELAQILGSHDLIVRTHQTRDPGEIVYSDPHQVAAIPKARRRRRSRRRRKFASR